jgi:AraC-like DNA-binding protein
MQPALMFRESPGFIPWSSGLFLSPGYGIHPTRVIDTWEIIFLVRGTLAMREEGCRFDLRRGQALLLRPGVEHAGVGPYARDTSFYWLHFSVAERKESGAHGDALRVPQMTTVARPDALTALLRRYLDDQSAGRLTSAMGAHLISLMLIELSLPADDGHGDGVRRQLARHAHDLILSRFASRLSTASIARELKCNPDYLGRCYRAAYGHGLIEAIHRRRLQRARQLLLDSAQPIESIADASGFADVLYFRRIFKRHEGMPPSAYRRMHGRVRVNTD